MCQLNPRHQKYWGKPSAYTVSVPTVSQTQIFGVLFIVFCTCDLQSSWRWTTHCSVWVHSRDHRRTGRVTRQHRLRSSERDRQLGICYFQRKGAFLCVWFWICQKCMIYYYYYATAKYISRHPSSQLHRKLAPSCCWHLFPRKRCIKKDTLCSMNHCPKLFFQNFTGHIQLIPNALYGYGFYTENLFSLLSQTSISHYL